MCHEFLEDCREAQEDGKAFHYAWLLLLIAMVSWRTLEDIKFPTQDPDLCEVEKFTSLWEMKDLDHIIDINMFWVLFESELQMVINQWLRLSPILHTEYTNIAEFKVDFHNLSIHAKKDAT